MIAVALLAAGVAGIWTNEEQVRFAMEAGREPPAWQGVRVEPAGDGWRATPVDSMGAQTGPARRLSAAEVAGGQLRLPGLDMRLARPFTCWAAIPKAGTDPLQWWGKRDIPIHDQGGEALLETDEPIPQRFLLRMRHVIWPSGPNRASLVLYVHSPANRARAIAYSWADPEARFVGLNIRTVQASCTRVGMAGGQ